MNLKTAIKRLVGKAFSIDTFEKLTEYSIWQRAVGFDMSGARLIQMPGKTWEELVARGREKLWSQAVADIGNPGILFLEFGVWKGESLEFFRTLISSEKSRLYGFDSFEGLPTLWRGMTAGHFETSGQAPRIDDHRVTLVRGWFQETLPRMLDDLADESRGRVVLVHFDADLYSSTLFLLYTVAQTIKDYYFIFDEFSGHESRALYNFLQASGAAASFVSYVRWEGCPAVVFGKLSLPGQ